MKRIKRHSVFNHCLKLSVFLSSLLLPNPLQAVPLSILQYSAGTQADITWARLENDRFIIYYDSTQPKLAEHALNSLEKAYSEFSLLLGTALEGQPLETHQNPESTKISRFKKIPVVISSRTDGASFANFIPQTIEIQSTRRPPAGLFQHELAHRMMYEHIDLNVGPAGRTFMLAMLPTWWLEGLPEYLTESLGRLETEGTLRAMVLNDSFLSWDRLHALYKVSGVTAQLGYATAGRFFKYFFEKTPHKSLQDLHQSLRNYQLIPPFFSGSYWLIKSLTQKWPGDLYEDFKNELKQSIIADLEGMPRLSEARENSKVFYSFNAATLLTGEKVLIYPDFATSSRPGGLVVRTYNDHRFTSQNDARMQQLSIVSQDTLAAHRKEFDNGGFWSASELKAPNRTRGSLVSYYAFSGKLNELNDSAMKRRVDFPLTTENDSAPIIDSIVAIAPKTAAVLSVNDTASKLFIMNANLEQHTQMGEWNAPDHVQIVRPHDAYKDAETAHCTYVIVNADQELTSLEKLCHGETSETLIPQGQYVIQDALMTGPDSFLLLVGWHNVQALMTWNKGHAEFISGVPDWISTLYPGPTEDRVLLKVLAGSNFELWSASLSALRNNHLEWLIKTPEYSKWWQKPSFTPYTPPFVRYAQKIRGAAPAPVAVLASIKPSDTKTVSTVENESHEQALLPDTKHARSTAITVIPAPYRFRHWMTYPNVMPPFLSGGVWSYGLFSRPFVDEMERFYVQLFFSYLDDPSVSDWLDNAGFEVNVYGNRVFDGWKANAYFRPRFNGVAYGFRCRLPKSELVVQCAQNRRTERTQYLQYLSLREYGLDFEWNRKFIPWSTDSSWTAKFSAIRPNSGNIFAVDRDLRAQNANLVSAGGNINQPLWKRTFFTKPISDLSKEAIYSASNLSFGIKTTRSLGPAQAGDGTPQRAVSFENYFMELKNSAAFRRYSLNLIHTYSATAGASPLNLEEFFQPFKTYLIGSNDGLQDISTSLAGNGLLSYRLVGKAQYRNSVSYAFPIIKSIDTRFALAYLERLEGELVLSRGGVSESYSLDKTRSLTTITGSARLTIDVKGYRFYPAILYGKSLDSDLWQLFTQLRFDQFW